MKDDIRLNGIAVNHITGQKINTCKSSEIYNIQNAICFFSVDRLAVKWNSGK